MEHGARSQEWSELHLWREPARLAENNTPGHLALQPWADIELRGHPALCNARLVFGLMAPFWPKSCGLVKLCNYQAFKLSNVQTMKLSTLKISSRHTFKLSNFATVRSKVSKGQSLVAIKLWSWQAFIFCQSVALCKK